MVEALPGVIGIRSGRERGANELALVVDRDRSESINVILSLWPVWWAMHCEVRLFRASTMKGEKYRSHSF